MNQTSRRIEQLRNELLEARAALKVVEARANERAMEINIQFQQDMEGIQQIVDDAREIVNVAHVEYETAIFEMLDFLGGLQYQADEI